MSSTTKTVTKKIRPHRLPKPIVKVPTTNWKFKDSKNVPLNTNRTSGGIPKYGRNYMRKLLNKGKYFGKKGTPTPPKKIEKPKKNIKNKIDRKKKTQVLLNYNQNYKNFLKVFQEKEDQKKTIILNKALQN